MMGGHHAVCGAVAWVTLTSTAPYTIGLHPMPPVSVLIGALVTAGAALLPDVDHHNATIANSGGLATQAIANVAEAASGGHRHGLHSLLAVAGFTALSWGAQFWHATVPMLGWIPLGSALLLLALVAFASRALKLSRGGALKLWFTAAVVTVAVLRFAPQQLAWLPLSVLIGVVVHLLGDFMTTGGLPLLWPWVPKPPKSVEFMPVLRRIWAPSGYVAVPVLGNAGSLREWLLCGALSLYLLYGLVATVAGMLHVDFVLAT